MKASARIYCLLSSSCLLSCSLLFQPFEDPIDAGDPDVIADADQPPDADVPHDAEVDDAEDGEAEVSPCPLNSGAFCTCDEPWDRQCDDGSYCLTIANLGTGDQGICAPSCDCRDYDAPCEEFPSRAIARCILVSFWPLTDETFCNCVLIDCEADSDCPYGQRCQEIVGTHGRYDGVRINICSP